MGKEQNDQTKGNKLNKNQSLIVPCKHFQWRLFIRNGVYYADGRKNGLGKHSMGTRDYKLAMEKLRDLDAIAWNSQSPLERVDHACNQVNEHKKIEIDDGWTIYLEDHGHPVSMGGLKESSVRKYNTHRKRFVNYCQQKSIKFWSSVGENTLKKYSKSLENKLAPITIHDDLTMEISVSNHLIKRGLLAPELKIQWELRKPAGAEQYCYEVNEVDRILEYSKNFKRNRWIYPTVYLLSRTGIRISEGINLEWPDIDFKNEMILIKDETFENKPVKEKRTVKDGESRLIPIDEDLMELLQERRRVGGPVLLGDKGKRLNYNHARDTFVKKVIEKLAPEFPSPSGRLGFRDGRFHSFRHFFVSQCFDYDISETRIKDWVGHSNSKIVNLYRHKKNKTSKLNMKQVKFGATSSRTTF